MKPPLLHSFPVYLKLITLGCLVVVSVLFVLIAGIVLAYPFYGENLMSDLGMIDPSNSASMLLAKYFQLVSQIGIFIVPSILFAYLDGRKVFSYLQLDRKISGVFILLSLVVLFVSAPFLNFIIEWNQSIRLPEALSGIELWMRSTEDANAKLTMAFLDVESISGLIYNIFLIGVMTALCEELLFRGVLQPLFIQWSKNVHVAVIITAFVFSCIHFQFYGFVPRFLLGILLGYSLVWSGTLWVPVLLHFINNGSAVVFAYLLKQGYIDDTFETIGTGETALMPVLVSLILTSGLILLFYKYRVRKIIALKVVAVSESHHSGTEST